MKKLSIIIVTLILAVALTVIQINVVQNATVKEEYIQVFAFTRSVEVNEIITQDMLQSVEVPLSLLPAGYICLLEDFTGNYLTREVYKGEIALRQDVTPVNPDDYGILRKTQDSNVFISIKPDPERAVAWQIRQEHWVDVIFVPQRSEEKESFRLENIRVAGITNEKFTWSNDTDSSESDTKPVYLILEVTSEDAQMIATARQFGSFELILKD